MLYIVSVVKSTAGIPNVEHAVRPPGRRRAAMPDNATHSTATTNHITQSNVSVTKHQIGVSETKQFRHHGSRRSSPYIRQHIRKSESGHIGVQACRGISAWVRVREWCVPQACQMDVWSATWADVWAWRCGQAGRNSGGRSATEAEWQMVGRADAALRRVAVATHRCA